MKNIKYVSGDVTDPKSDSDIRLIIHCCNDLGVMGSGVAKALFMKWPSVKSEYVKWKKESDFSNADFLLGNIQIIEVEKGISVANMMGQHGIYQANGIPPVRYDAIKSCLETVAEWVEGKEAGLKSVSIHAPRFGAGLAGGDWGTIESLIIETLCSKNIDVTVYDLDSN